MVHSSQRLLSERHMLRIPADGKFVGNLSEQFVAGRITPEHEIMGGNVFLRNVGVVFYAGQPPELLTPMIGGVGEFRRGPGADLFVERFACWTDHEKAVHERIVNRPLEIVTLA